MKSNIKLQNSQIMMETPITQAIYGRGRGRYGVTHHHHLISFFNQKIGIFNFY